MSGHYRQRLEHMIQKALSDLLLNEVRDPRVEGVVFTSVEMNRDLSVAKVFYMPPVGEDPYEVTRGLHKSAGFLRGAVGRALGLREAPEIRFQMDESLDRVNRLEELLDEEGE